MRVDEDEEGGFLVEDAFVEGVSEEGGFFLLFFFLFFFFFVGDL